jgi:hypothetical protein
LPETPRSASKRRRSSSWRSNAGATRPLGRPPATPLAMRNPLLTWRLVAALSLLFNLLLLMLLAR